jgi:hypothetical protein
LVITTVHASTLEESLMGLIFLAEQAMGPGVQNILAAGMTAAIHQTMKDGIPWLKYVFTEPEAPGDPVRAIIRDNRIGALSTYIDRTSARLTNPTATAAQPTPSLTRRT